MVGANLFIRNIDIEVYKKIKRVSEARGLTMASLIEDVIRNMEE